MKSITAKCGCEFKKGAWVTATCEHGREFIQVTSGAKFWTISEVTETPTVVCLCGSTRFYEVFQDANLKETLAGKIVLTIGRDTKGDDELFEQEFPDELATLKAKLDILQFRKIEFADEVLILNVNGYIEESTARELAYARAMGKKVRFLEANDEN